MLLEELVLQAIKTSMGFLPSRIHERYPDLEDVMLDAVCMAFFSATYVLGHLLMWREKAIEDAKTKVGIDKKELQEKDTNQQKKASKKQTKSSNKK